MRLSLSAIDKPMACQRRCLHACVTERLALHSWLLTVCYVRVRVTIHQGKAACLSAVCKAVCLQSARLSVYNLQGRLSAAFKAAQTSFAPHMPLLHI